MMSDTTIAKSDAGDRSWAFGLMSVVVLSCVLAVRLWLEFVHIDQPIFEGYIGRQIPTAMVARGLDREGSFLYPTLQTGPFPSWFLIEAPVYAQAVAWLEQITGFPLERCGRLISLLALAVATASLADLARRHFGGGAAVWASIFLLTWPVSIRYARAFQPDMFALALFMAGAAFRARADDDVAQGRENDIFPTLSWFALALALATKVTLAPFLIGLAYPRMTGRPNHTNVRFLGSTLIPAVMWYGWAAWLQFEPAGTSGGYSQDAFGFWLNAPGPLSLLSISKAKAIAMNVFVKSWTPVALFLLLPIPLLPNRPPAIRRWAIALLCWFSLVGGKAHHGYYWLAPTPLLAVAGGWFMTRLNASRLESTRIVRMTARQLGIVAGGLLSALSVVMAYDTYETPPEWRPLVQDLSRFRAWINSTPGMPVVGHEATIFAIDRPGFRWEWTADGQRRAASAFGERLAGESPEALLKLYAEKGAVWFLALETDPEWIHHGRALEPILGKMRIVQRSGSLVLYELTETMAPNERR